MLLVLVGETDAELGERDSGASGASFDDDLVGCFIDAFDIDLVNVEVSPEDDPKLASVPGRDFNDESCRK